MRSIVPIASPGAKSSLGVPDSVGNVVLSVKAESGERLTAAPLMVSVLVLVSRDRVPVDQSMIDGLLASYVGR